ncbi:hypothetical protein BDQ17DRAFT_1367900 [Cyathus striatus]|nr:hypothetical protein BDQ17DRAFT_1367900 [Cyathus striatus]
MSSPLPYSTPDELLRKLKYFHDVVDECRPQLKAGNLEEFKVVHAELVEKHHRPLSLETDTPKILEAHFQEYERFCRLPCNSYYDVCRRSVVAMGALTLMSVHLGPSSDAIMEKFMSYIQENIEREQAAASIAKPEGYGPLIPPPPDVFYLPPIPPDLKSLSTERTLKKIEDLNKLSSMVGRLVGCCTELGDDNDQVWYKLVGCEMEKGGLHNFKFKIAFLDCPSIIVDIDELKRIIDSSIFLQVTDV